MAAELAAVLAFSAISNNDRVGLVQFTDRIERFLPPRKGARHVLRLIRDVLFYQPEHRGTSLREGLDFLNRVLHRRTIVFLLSDFLDRDFESSFKRTGRRHDLIALRISDPREEELPAVGLLELEDAETGQRRLLDTDRAAVRDAFRRAAEQRRDGPVAAGSPVARRSHRGLDRRRPSRRADPFFPVARTAHEETLTMIASYRLAAAGLALLLLGPLLHAQFTFDPPQMHGDMEAELTVAVAKQTPVPGLGAVTLTLTVKGPATLEVEEPQLGDATDAWMEARLPSTRIVEDQRTTWSQVIRLKQIKPGVVPVADVAVRFRDGPDATWGEARWVDIFKQVRDVPHPPAPPAQSSSLRRWGLATILGLVGLALVGAWRMKRRRGGPAPLSPEQYALRELEHMEQDLMPPRGDAEVFHTQLAQVVRRYLAERSRCTPCSRPHRNFSKRSARHRRWRRSGRNGCASSSSAAIWPSSPAPPRLQRSAGAPSNWLANWCARRCSDRT